MPFLTSSDAEAAFYDAFQRADINAMREVLAMDDDCVCIHPGGERIEGASAILESWAGILSGGTGLRIVVSDTVVQATERLAVHHVVESLNHEMHADTASYTSATVAATNVYRRSDDGWHMVAHCAMPGRPERRTGTLH